MSIERATLAKDLRWAGRIISLSVVLFFFIFGLGYFIDTLTTEGLQQALGGMDNILGIVSMVLALVGVIISWRWLLPAGILLIFAYLLGAISSGVSAMSRIGYFNLSQFRDFWTIPGIIYLVAGVLFILSWWLTRKTVKKPKIAVSGVSD